MDLLLLPVAEVFTDGSPLACWAEALMQGALPDKLDSNKGVNCGANPSCPRKKDGCPDSHSLRKLETYNKFISDCWLSP